MFQVAPERIAECSDREGQEAVKRSERLSNNNRCNPRLTLWKMNLVAKLGIRGKRNDLPDGLLLYVRASHAFWLLEALPAHNAVKVRFLFAV